MIKESFLGLVLGFLCAIPFWIVEGIGFIVDNQRGASMAAVAPQLQVFFLAMPIKSAVGLFMLILFAASLFDFGAGTLYDLRNWPERLSRAFASGSPR